MSALECYDWQNKSVEDGQDYYPDKNDLCYLCRCNRGYPTMCKTVSCAPPDCPNPRQIPGVCCKFECLDENGKATGVANGTGPPKVNTDVSGSPTDHTVTDLGLRLVASTVTTFLILALLLFLIHRFRQRRLLMTLRRYSRRREQLDDLVDSFSISPDFFGIQCPPYEDPPPPYTPPKPQPGEQPPPYEDINRNTEEPGSGCQHGSQVVSSNCDQNCSERGNNSSGTIRENTQQSENIVVGTMTNLTGTDRNRSWNGNVIQIFSSRHNRNSQAMNLGNPQDERNASVHFRSNSGGGQPSITMGIHTRNRHNRNRLSDSSFNTSPSRHPPTRHSASNNSSAAAALSLELRNTVRNYRNRINRQSSGNDNITLKSGDLSSSTTDIGESTTSADSLSSSPESPTFETEDRIPDNQNSHSTELLSEDANSTVKRFFDRQFGGLPKHRRYPTTMSQSWTSVPVSPPEQNFRQSVSLSSFQPKVQSQALQKSASMVSAVPPVSRQNLSRSKSEHLKTNGSLINQPYKSPVRNISHAGHAVRVAYKEPDEFPASLQQRSSCDFNVNTNVSSLSSNVSVCSSGVPASSRLAAAMLDPGDIIVTRRQDELRRLRLSHLLNNQALPSPVKPSEQPRSLQRSFSENSLNSSTVCSEIGAQGCDVAISNDAPYPPNTYRNFLQSCLANHNSRTTQSSGQQKTCSSDTRSSATFLKNPSFITSDQSESKYLQEQNVPTRTGQKLSTASMIHSWHAEHIDSCDDNSSAGEFCLNTLGRNTERNIEKKTFLDKDVTNIFFPYNKPNIKNLDIDHSSVPSSEMRACASQLYNLETETKKNRKDRKRSLFKRHSAGCFPINSGILEPRSMQKLSSIKPASVQYDKATTRTLPDSGAKDFSKKKTSSKNRKSDKHLVSIGPINSPKTVDITFLQARTSVDRPNSLHVSAHENFDSPVGCSQSVGKGEMRSKSLGRTDFISSQKPRQSESRVRKKRSSHGSHFEQERNLFKQELERVLYESPADGSVSKGSFVGLNQNPSAITQV